MSEVNIRKRGTKWEYRFEGAKIEGKRKHITKSGFRTKKEALGAGTKALAEYNSSGISFTPTEISVHDYFDFWLKEYCELELKQTTYDNYKKKIENHIDPALGKYKLKALTPAVLQQFINQKFNEGFSRNTLLVIKGILSGSLNYAVEPAGFIKLNPMLMVKLPGKRATPETPTRKKVREITTPDQWEQIIERFPEGHPAHIPLVLAYRCGLRLGEVFGLMWEDVDFENSTLRVDRQVQMNEEIKKWSFTSPKYDSYRIISVDKNTLELLDNEKEKQKKAKDYYKTHYTQLCAFGFIETSEHFFDSGYFDNKGTPVHMVMTRENGAYIQPRIIQHVGRVIHGKNNKTAIVISENWDFHSLRHTHATALLEVGTPLPVIQKRLGHAKIDMTEHYTDHVTDKMQGNLNTTINNLY